MRFVAIFFYNLHLRALLFVPYTLDAMDTFISLGASTLRVLPFFHAEAILICTTLSCSSQTPVRRWSLKDGRRSSLEECAFAISEFIRVSSFFLFLQVSFVGIGSQSELAFFASQVTYCSRSKSNIMSRRWMGAASAPFSPD